MSENELRSRWNPRGRVPNGGCQEGLRHGLVQTISGYGKAVQVVCVSRETTSTTFELMDVSPAGKSYSGPEEWPRHNGSEGNDTGSNDTCRSAVLAISGDGEERKIHQQLGI